MRSISSLRAVNKKCTMRFLIVATAVLACAAAAPSGALLAAPYSSLAVAPAVHLAPTLPTISAGDINGAAIDAHVEASDHFRAAVDANRQLHDKASELHGQAINNAQENTWRAVDAVKTVEAQLDGAAAGAAPAIAKSLVRGASVVAPVSYAAAPVAPVSYAAPVAPVSYAAPVAPVSYAAPVAPISYAAPAVYASAPIGYDAAFAPSVYSAPFEKTVVSESLSQTHPGYFGSYSHGW